MNMGPDIEWGAGVGSLTVVGFVDLAGKVEQDLSIFCEFKNHVRATRPPDAPRPHRDLADGREGEHARPAHPHEHTPDPLIDPPRPAPPSCCHLPQLQHRCCHTAPATWARLGCYTLTMPHYCCPATAIAPPC